MRSLKRSRRGSSQPRERVMAHLLLPQLGLVEERFDMEKVGRWVQENWTLSLYANAVYVAAIFLGRRWMRNRQPFHLRRALTLWNTGLAVFSLFAFLRFFPLLQSGVRERGFSHSVCNPRLMLTPPCMLWGLLFVLSKAVEFGDTAFIVLRKTPLNFLHWYHHISVLSYSARVQRRAGRPDGGVVRDSQPIRPFGHVFLLCPEGVRCRVTAGRGSKHHSATAGSVAVLGAVYTQKRAGQPCSSHDDVMWSGVVMYASYMVLFANFFYQRYLKKPSK